MCDASPYVDDSPVTPTSIKVGEAAFSVAPLSSQGVQIAIASALQGRAVVHRMLRLPERAAVTQTFYTDRIRDLDARHR